MDLVREEAAQVQAARDQTEQVLRQELHSALNRLESAESALTAAWEGSELLAEGRDQLETALADADLRLRRQEEQLSELEALRVRVQGLEASDAEERLEEAQLKLLEQEELLAKAAERERFLEAELAQARKRERKK